MKRFTNHPEPWGEFIDVKFWPEIKHPERMRRCGSFAKRKGYCMSGMMIPSNARSTIRLSWSIIFPTKRLSLGQNAEEQVIKTI